MSKCVIPSFANPVDAAFKAIKQEVGTNETLFTTYVSDVVGDVDANGHFKPSTEFESWYKSRGYKTPLDFNANGGKMKEAIKRYYRFKHPDASKTVLDNADVTIAKQYLYESVSDRNEGKVHAISFLNEMINDVEHKQNMDMSKIDKRSYYKNQLINRFRAIIANRIAKKENGNKANIINEIKAIEEVYNNTKENKFLEVSAIANRLDISITQNRNLLSLYTELITNPDYFNELVRRSDGHFPEDNTLGNSNYSQDENEQLADLDIDTIDENGNMEVDYDSSFFTFDHSGTYVNVMSHLGNNVKSYFNSLKKIVDANYPKDGKPVVDTNNAFGLPSCMNVNECATMLYHNADYTNKTRMIASIHKIAQQYKGFEAFEIFARDLEKDSDFANLIYSTFGKIVTSKIEVNIESGVAKASISNKRSNKYEALRFEFMNTVKASSTIADSDYYRKEINNLKEYFDNNAKDLSKGLRNENALTMINNLISIIKAYYPTVDEGAVKAYIYNTKNSSGNVDEKRNFNQLITDLSVTINEAEITRNNIIDQRAALNNAIKYNNRKDIKKAAISDPSVLKDTTAIIAKETATDKLKGIATSLADKFVPYSIVKVETTSVNALGNQSSDVINNNQISYIGELLNSKANVKDADGNFTPNSPISKWVKDLFGNAGERVQYKLSSILVEHTDANGNIINYGLFKEVSQGKYVPTTYANKLLKSNLFNGAHNYDNSENVVYPKMDDVDYTVTAFYAFFNDERIINGNKGLTLGNYFMRTPSDAPKNFMVSTPRYKFDNIQVGSLISSNGEVNHNHPIYQQFRQIFKQELLNAGQAFNTMFDTLSDGRAKPNHPRSKVSDRELYENYHYVKNVIDDNGKLTGKVFTSDRLIVNGTNYGQQWIDANIDFFYGGATADSNGKTHLRVTKDATGNVTDIVLTPEQNQSLDSTIDNFIKAQINDAINKFDKSKKLISGEVTNNQIAEFALNYRLFYINCNDLFEGDTKFYKDTQDFLKRAKEAQAAGVPYGIMDYENTFDFSDRVEIPSVLDNETFVKEFGNIKMYNKFRAVTINNSIMTGETVKKDGILAKKLASIFERQGMTKKDAIDKANNMMAGYANTKVNDAQSYITVEEWIRRIVARGQFAKHSKLIGKLMRGEELNGDDINEFVQVQKNFYYDLHYDSTTGIRVPRQIKNAEFVLVPQFVKDTELEQVYDLMNDLGIDQLNTKETSKAGKARVLDLWDNEGKLNEDAITDFKANAKGYVELYDYNHLYTQQETPQHINSENKAAIQIMKKIVDNIDPNSPLYPTKQKFMETYSKLVRKSFIDTMNELGITFNKHGEPIITDKTKQKMYDAFLREAERLGVDSNMADYLTLDPLTGEPKMPNGLNLTSSKIENIAQALFNSRITRQTLPGFHVAQVTNIGFRKLAENKESILTNGNLKYHPEGWINDKLGYEIDDKQYARLTDEEKKDYHRGVTHYIEVMLPKANFGLSQYDDETALRMLQEAHADQIIGYRIPTEGKQSIAIMKVAGFTSDGNGSTIVVPNDWVGQTGSDFDIDSVYGIQFNTELDIDSNGNRPDSMFKIGYDNDKRTLQNTICQCMIDILRSDESLEENLGRSNFDDIARILGEIRQTFNRTTYDFFDQANMQNEVMSNARLKGLSVVRDTFASICNTVKPRLNGYHVEVAYPASKYKLSDLKKRFGSAHKVGDKIIVEHQMFGWSNDNKNIDGRLITSYTSQTTAHVLDAVKAGSVPNVNDDTFKVYKTIVDLGSNFETAIKFMCLPYVKVIADNYNANNSIYAEYTGDPIRQAIRTWAKEVFGEDFDKNKKGKNIGYNELIERLKNNGIDIENMPIEALDAEIMDKVIKGEGLAYSTPVEEFKGSLSDKDYFNLQTILQYRNLNEIATKINDITLCSNPDKFGAKQSIYETFTVFSNIVKLASADDAKVLTVPVNGQEISILEAIYPGVKRVNNLETIDNVIARVLSENRAADSKYSTLYNFLRYASAPSIAINSQLFDTKNEVFRNKVLSLQNAFTNPNITLSGKMYKDFEKYILSYLYKQSPFIRGYLTIDKETGSWKVAKGVTTDAELNRIRAINRVPNTEFEVKDITNISQDEIYAFSEFTPAEKLYWVIKNYSNPLIGKYLTPELNSYGNKQVIRFTEDTTNIEEVYQAFNDSFYNSDPFIKLLAADLIKYAFVVEGFNMGRNNVSKVIQNRALMDNSNEFGTGIADYLRSQFNSLEALDDSTMYQLTVDYVRSTKPKEVRIMQSDDANITTDSSGIVKLNPDIYHPRTIAIRRGKNVMYYANYDDNYYPINKLEKGEMGEWSAVGKNNVYASSEYWKGVIDGKIDKNTDFTDYTYKAERIDSPTGERELDLNTPIENQYVHEAAAFTQAKNTILNWFNKEDAPEKMFLWSPIISKYLPKDGNFSTQLIDGKEYLIQKVNINKFIQPYLSKTTDLYIGHLSPWHQAIIKQLKAMNFNEAKDIFLVKPVEDNVYSESSLDETTTTVKLGAKSVRAINRRAKLDNNPNLVNAKEELDANKITGDDDVITNRMEETFGTISEFANKESERIIDGLKHFIKDETNKKVYKITDNESIKAILNDENERRRFLKFILDARAFMNEYGLYGNLNIDSEDDSIKSKIDVIKKAVARVNDPILSDAEKIFAEQYLNKISDNPLVREQMLSVLDGYHSTGIVESWINDLQETTNPLIQIISKDVMANIRTKEMIAKKAAEKFKDEVNAKMKEAASKGESINLSHIIDDAGRFIQNYNEQFEKDLINLINKRDLAEQLYTKGSKEYIEAQLDLEEWKLEHVQQPFEDDFYRSKITEDRRILKYNPEIFIEYKKLLNERDEYRSHISGTELDDSWREKIKDVNRRIRLLESEHIYDEVTETWTKKPEVNTANPAYSKKQAHALKVYKENRKALYEKYFDSEENAGFKATLNNNLNIIQDYENKGTRSAYNEEDYKKAKEWVASNATYVIDDEITRKVTKAYKDLYDDDAANDVREKKRKINTPLHYAVDKHKAKDRFGIIDATEFTDKEIENIKNEQVLTSRARINGAGNEKVLIHNGKDDENVYKTSFYLSMTTDGFDNPNYYATVTEINNILRTEGVYDSQTHTVNTSKLSLEQLEELSKLYTKLNNIKKRVGSSNGKDVAEFIKKNVTFVTDNVRFESEEAIAKSKGDEYYQAWYKANTEEQKNSFGQPTGNRVPNHFLYSQMTVKEPNKWIDKTKTEAIKTLKENVSRHPTNYWYKKLATMQNKLANKEITKEEYDKWYNANTIYDAQTQSVIPIKCWMTNEIMTSTQGEWEANFTEKHTTPKEEYKNKNYIDNASTGQNYKAGTGYDNNVSMNNSEVEFRNWLQSYLLTLARTKDSQRYFKNGYLPARASEPEHDAWWYAKEAGKWLGFSVGANGREKFDNNIGYEYDIDVPMPMTHLLKSKVEDRPEPKPERLPDETEEAYIKRFETWRKHMDEYNKQQQENHKKLVDKDWIGNIAEFIERAGHYNAVQDNKYMLFYGLNMLRRIKTIQPSLGFPNLHKDDKESTENKVAYDKAIDENLVKQYENWIRRLIYDQYRRPNKAWTKIASIMQSITSANFMMLNVRGGIANVNYGETQIIAEAFAEEYFGKVDYLKGKQAWFAAVPSFFANMYKETSTSKVDAIVKFMHCVDFDQLTEASRDDLNFGKYSERLRDMMFSPLTMGENFMQNGAMLSMMMSHRLVKNDDYGLNGKTQYILQNESEYIRSAHEKALKSVLSTEMCQRFDKFCEDIKSDENTAKGIMWFREDLTTKFAQQFLTHNQWKEFVDKKKGFEDKARKDFKQLPTLYDQLELNSRGTMGFVKDSIMDKLLNPNEDGSIDAYKILGAFKGRVISVNKKIHGVYDKLGAAQVEKFWLGPLVMQYHKHIFPGIMKHWRRQGGFNEERGSIEKGSYTALYDFLSTPIRRIKNKIGMTDAEVEAMEGVQNVFQSVCDFAMNMNLYWNLLPEYEKANIRRNLGDVCGVLAALFIAVGIRCMADDDDDNILTNLCLYEADRLSSECFQYNPIGAVSEGKKLWSSPVAVSSIIGDVINSMGTLSHILIEGDDYDPYYHSGKYAKQHRLKVYIERRIPIYRGIKSVLEIANDNHYYKLGDNMLSIVPVKSIAKFIREETNMK